MFTVNAFWETSSNSRNDIHHKVTGEKTYEDQSISYDVRTTVITVVINQMIT